MLAAWSEALHTAAAVVADPRVQSLLGDPHVTPAQLAQLVLDIAGAVWVNTAVTSCRPWPKPGA